MKRSKISLLAAAALVSPLAASAQVAAEDDPLAGILAALAASNAETAFVFNTLLFLIGGFLVFFMACGFCMLEAGLVRSKNVTMQLTKNVGLFSIATIAYYLIGFNLMYPGDFNGWLAFGSLLSPTVLEPCLLYTSPSPRD